MTYLYMHKDKNDCPKGREFEVDQKITDERLLVCPECGELVVKLINSEGGFTWKGGAPTPKVYTK